MNTTQPYVSVIIPAYKAAAFIGDTLDSLRTQTFRNFEVIVVNDGCPDTANLERVLQPYQHEIRYLKQANAGPAAARNAALAVSSAPLIALLDSDDVWEPDYLQVQVGLLDANPNVDVVYPNATFFGEDRGVANTFMEVFPSRGEVTVASLALRECYVFISATCRREAVIRAGGFDVNIRGAEDFDLWLSMAEQGSRFLYHSRPLVRYRFRPDSLSSDSPALLNTVLALYKKHLSRPELLVPDRNAIAEAIRRTQAELDLYLGKQALQSSNIDVAIERLESANGVFHRSKLSAVVWMLRLAPGLASKYIQRQRQDSQKKPVVKPVNKS